MFKALFRNPKEFFGFLHEKPKTLMKDVKLELKSENRYLKNTEIVI